MRWATTAVNDRFEVSDTGLVRRRSDKRECALYKRPMQGYVLVHMCRDRVKRLFYVHRLVAEAFCGGCPAGMDVNHLNFERADNRAVNLEVVTRKQNLNYSMAAGRCSELGKNTPRGEASPHSKLTQAQVDAICQLVAAGGIKALVAREFDISKQQVANIVNRVSWA